MSTKAIIVCVVGTAVSSVSAQDRPVLQSIEHSGQVFHAVRATAITGLTADGQFIYGETIELGQNNGERFMGATTAYDSALMVDTDLSGLDLDPVCADLAPHGLATPGSRYFFGTEFSFQSFAEDVIPASCTAGGTIDEIVMAGTRPLCDNGTGTTSEVLQMVVTSWENMDNFPDVDGTDGWAYSDGSGFVSPFELDASDNYVGFNGGVILTYADTANGDELFSFGALGYGLLLATGLNTLCVPMPSNTDYDNDGDGDGGIMVQWTRGDGGDGLGNMLGGFYPATRAQSMLWGTTAMETAGTTCPYPDATYPGFGVGNSDGIVWGEGEDLCNDPAVDPDWSTGGPLGDATIDERYDPDFDVADWFGIVPDFEALGLMVRFRVTAPPPTATSTPTVSAPSIAVIPTATAFVPQPTSRLGSQHSTTTCQNVMSTRTAHAPHPTSRLGSQHSTTAPRATRSSAYSSFCLTDMADLSGLARFNASFDHNPRPASPCGGAGFFDCAKQRTDG